MQDKEENRLCHDGSCHRLGNYFLLPFTQEHYGTAIIDIIYSQSMKVYIKKPKDLINEIIVMKMEGNEK